MKRLLTIDDLFDPDKKIRFDGSPASEFPWLKDGEAYLVKTPDPATGYISWSRVDAASGVFTPLIDCEVMASALAGPPGVSSDEARKICAQGKFTFNPAKNAFLFSHAGNLYHYALESSVVRRLTDTSKSEVGEEFSPDGRRVSFVRDFNIFVLDLETGVERQLTSGGHSKLFNGRLDWVYQEELYGRGNFKGYWWSPDGLAVAFLQLDISPVKEFPLVDDIEPHPRLEISNYPLAGEPNPRVRLGFVQLDGDEVRWVDLSQYEASDFLIVRVGWTPDSRGVVYQVQDREQRWLDLNVVNAATGEIVTLVHESSNTWVGVTGEPRWLKDGSFLWLSERTGWKHVYHYGVDGELRGSVTSGDWEVRTLHGGDETEGWIYFSATLDSPVGERTYRVRLSGADIQCLTPVAGSHRSVFDPALRQFIDVWSDIATPPQVRLHTAGGELIRIVDENRVEALNTFEWSRPRLLQVDARDGFVLEASLILPPNFDRARKYPVMCYTYSGPHTPRVIDAWGGAVSMWHQLLAQHGYIVWTCDNRTAGGKGAQATWPVYRNAGELELRDLEDGLSWLKNQGYVDSERIGLWGWSYGGYMTSYALTHSKAFKIGIAGAPVTDWRNYDSIYTERYMATPQNNLEGYDRSSVVKAAANLCGKLLLIHGAIDDNVHPQNTMQFLYELQKAGKQVELMIYPKARHHVEEPALVKHLYTMMTNFILRNL